MDVLFIPLYILILSIILLINYWKHFIVLVIKSRDKFATIPTAPGRHVIFGHLKYFFPVSFREKGDLMVSTVENLWANKIMKMDDNYLFSTGISKVYLGILPISVVVTAPEMASIVIKESIRPGFFNGLEQLLSGRLILLEGDQWKKHRKILNPAFDYKSLLALPSISMKRVNELITFINEGLQREDHGIIIENIVDHMYSIAFRCIFDFAFTDIQFDYNTMIA